MIPSPRLPPGGEPELPQDIKDEPAHSIKELLEKAIHKAFFGETLQIQADGCEAVLSIGISLGDQENEKKPIEDWDQWRENAMKRWSTVMGFYVAAATMNKGGEPATELRPVGGGSDPSRGISYVRDQHVDGQRDHIVRGQYRSALAILKPLVGDLLEMLTERGYFPLSYDNVRIPDAPAEIRMPPRRFGGVEAPEPEEEEDEEP